MLLCPKIIEHIKQKARPKSYFYNHVVQTVNHVRLESFTVGCPQVVQGDPIIVNQTKHTSRQSVQKTIFKSFLQVEKLI